MINLNVIVLSLILNGLHLEWQTKKKKGGAGALHGGGGRAARGRRRGAQSADHIRINRIGFFCFYNILI